MRKFRSVAEFVSRERPSNPCYCLHQTAVEQYTRDICSQFRGEVGYAVKTNSHPDILEAALRGGISAWDVASIKEIRLVAERTAMRPMWFMNPVKPREHIAEAFHEFGVTTFAVDRAEEIEKISLACEGARDLTYVVRLAVPNSGALISMSTKFGVDIGDAVMLLQQLAKRRARCGITFHVGSQCLDPMAYAKSIAMVRDVVCQSGVLPDVIDIGGGFPAQYDGAETPIDRFMDVISEALSAFAPSCLLRCEPGRYISAPGISVLARIEAVRHAEAMLHINEGIYGSLSEINALNCRCPVHALRGNGSHIEGSPQWWTIAGPTCASDDVLSPKFQLPATVREGDYLEFCMMGAYSYVFATQFNGFGIKNWVDISPEEIKHASPEVCQEVCHGAMAPYASVRHSMPSI